MSFCLACAEWITGGRVCSTCDADLRFARRFRVSDELIVIPALHHGGAARRLVHRLKYQGVVEIADLFAERLLPLLPGSIDGLIPVPRASLRRLRYGVDPSFELARALSRRSGLRLFPALRAPLWWRRHAVQDRDKRPPPRFRAIEAAPPGSALVDDVATSGSTLGAAMDALGGDFRHGIVATSPGRMRVPAPSEAGEVPWREVRT